MHISTERRTCIVVNKSRAHLAASESFLDAHISHFTGRVPPLLGRQTTRRAGLGSGPYLCRQNLPMRGLRWLVRKLGVTTVARQDTRALVRYFRRQRVDVVMAEYGPTGLDVMEACKIANVPLITHFHGWDAYVLAVQPDQLDAYRELFERSIAIVAVSRHMRAHLISLAAPPDKVIWNPCGADVDSAPQAKPDEAPPVYLSIGRATPKKATIVSLLAFAKVIRELPQARLQLIGGEPDAVSLQATRALGIEAAVSFMGTLPHATVLERLRDARCYLHPSVTAPDGDMEGTPVSVMEAMAAGLPVVATRHGGIMDLLDGTSAGMLVDEYDVDATAESMLAYGLDPARAASDGLHGRKLLREKWSMESSLGKLETLVELARTRDRAGIAELAASD